MNAQILKNMVVDGRLLQSGDIIDVKGWKHAKSLNRNRYIRIIEDEAVKPAKVEAPVVETPKAEEKPKAKKVVASK
ncbi:MAG: hypothetical protein EBU08_06280 [Micrococcales bacterium]|nr:hypothetical protein [Micrococcales bacterium]